MVPVPIEEKSVRSDDDEGTQGRHDCMLSTSDSPQARIVCFIKPMIFSSIFGEKLEKLRHFFEWGFTAVNYFCCILIFSNNQPWIALIMNLPAIYEKQFTPWSFCNMPRIVLYISINTVICQSSYLFPLSTGIILHEEIHSPLIIIHS